VTGINTRGLQRANGRMGDSVSNRRLALMVVTLAAIAIGIAMAAMPQTAETPIDGALSAPTASAAEPIPVHGSRPLVPPVHLTLAGEINALSSPYASATVSVHVAGQVVPATVTYDQAYRASIQAPPDAMVSVEVLSSRVRYRALLGSAAQLKRRSGGDGVVVPSEHASLRVTPWTTAIAFLSVRALGGRAPGSGAELERTRRALASSDGWSTGVKSDIASIAHVLAEVARGTIALPAGMATGHDLIADPVAFQQVLETEGVQAAALEYPVLAPVHVPLRSLADVPQQLMLVTRMTVADLPTGARNAQLLVRTAPGRYRVYFDPWTFPLYDQVPAPPVQPEFVASINDAGELQLVPDGPVDIEEPETGGGHVSIESIVLRRMTDGERHDVWASRTTWVRFYPDRPERESEKKSHTVVWWGSEPAAIAKPVTWHAEGRPVALPTFRLAAATMPGSSGMTLIHWENVQHRFDPDGNGITLEPGWKVDDSMQPRAGDPGGRFSWSRHDAGRRIRVSSEGVDVDFWVVDDADPVADLVFYKATVPSGPSAGQTLVGAVLAIGGAALPISDAQAHGVWKLASASMDLAYPDAYAPAYFVRHADGTADEYLDARGLEGSATLSTWAVAGDRLYDTRYHALFDGYGRYVKSCADAFAAGASECAPVRIRVFKPIARVGARIYGVTDFYHQLSRHPPGYTGPYKIVRNGGGMIYYDCIEGGCLTFSTGNPP
jgi:hypothetical protein